MKRIFHVVLLAFLGAAALHITSNAQTSPTRVLLQDSLEFSLIHGNDTIPASWFSPSYDYEMIYDSSRTQFVFTECKKNGSLLKLLAWNYTRLYHAPQELLSFNSRTENFLINTGDTISFYREMEWYNPITNEMLTTNYYALDTLEMIVYLVDASDGKPLAQLDSIGVLPRTTRGTPIIYGTRPIMALVSYVVPQSLNGDSALIGVTIRARGSGAYHFTRYDGITVGLSERLNKAEYHTYLANFGSVYAKRSINDLLQGSKNGKSMLSVSSSTGDQKALNISFNGPENGGRTAVAIYDESGNLIFCPYNSISNHTRSEVSYRLSSNGTYFVTLLHNGRIARTEKVIVTQ